MLVLGDFSHRLLDQFSMYFQIVPSANPLAPYVQLSSYVGFSYIF